jgi:hypothetical protein
VIESVAHARNSTGRIRPGARAESIVDLKAAP